MRNSTFSQKTLQKFFLLVLVVLFPHSNLFAEGTPQASPNATTISGLLLAPDLGNGTYFNAADDNRLKFYINNSSTERLYFGFDAYNYVQTAPTRLSNATGFKLFWRIMRNVAGTPTVQASGQWNATAAIDNGEITTYAQAVNGPNINGVTTGYVPITFTPTVVGEYWIEVFRGTDVNTPSITANDRGTLPLFDLTVASGPAATATKINGRVYCEKWGMIAMTSANVIASNANASPTFYSYTDDQCIVKVGFGAIGFQPLAFNVALNNYGTSTTPVDWLVTRKSVNAAVSPSLTNGYRTFLNIPDPIIFPVSVIPSPPTFANPAVTGCGPYTFKFNAPEAGDVKILLDLNGIAGYQASSSDRILEFLNVTAGLNSETWDGLNGLGVAVASGSSINLKLTFLKGRFNIPLYDAELNVNGVQLSIIAPILIANATTYWDDSALTAIGATCDATLQTNNITGAGINNAAGTTGTSTQPGTHAWNGNGNSTQTIPAPAVASNDTDALQCNDFGNARTINTWGWGYTSAATDLNILIGCADLNVVKTVNTLSPLYGSQVTFTITATNNGAASSVNAIVNDLLPSGYTYLSNNGGGSYNSTTGVWTIGTLASGSSVSLQIVATVNGSGNYANTATVTNDLTDPNTDDNTSTVVVSPTCNATVAPTLIKN